jgi:hypothetical protein
LELELKLIQKPRIGIVSKNTNWNCFEKHELELIQKTGIGIGIDSKNTNWNSFRKHELELSLELIRKTGIGIARKKHELIRNFELDDK